MDNIKQEKFIFKAKNIHLNKYDYSLVEFINTSCKVKIICKKHNYVFEQTPANHTHLTRPQGCPKCAGAYTYTTEEFLQKLKDVNNYNDKYDYSLVKFVNSATKVIIVDEYGFKHQLNPQDLYKNKKVCFKNLIDKQEYFKFKSSLVHNNKYDYSLVEYVTYRTKVKIICPKHGIFEQAIQSHLEGKGCRICSGCSKSTTQEFIDKANIVHNYKFSYPEEYINAKTKLKIICKLNNHVFNQTPNDHLHGYGCPKCSSNSVPTTEEFIQILKNKNYFEKGGVYEYCNFEKFIYSGYNTKSIVFCKFGFEHKIIPDSLLSGSNLTIVSVVNKTEYYKYKVNIKHNNKYDYSLVEYKGDKHKIEVICLEHGSFFITPSSHLLKYGCPSCSDYGFNSMKNAILYVYLIQKDNIECLGFGVTNQFKERNRTHQANFKKYNVNATLIAKFFFEKGSDAIETETILKRHSDIINLGIIGFQTECLPVKHEKYIFETVSKIGVFMEI